MTSQLAEGQSLASRYTLLRRMEEAFGDNRWLAVDESTGDRVSIRFIEGSGADSWDEARAAVERARGLVHHNIAPALHISEHSPEHSPEHAGLPYVVEPHFKGAQRFSWEGKSRSELWSLLSQLIDAVSYAHQLNIPHGHLHPGNLIVDASGQLQVTGFGLPAPSSSAMDHDGFLSPQAKAGDTPDLSDDIYSLGALIFWCLTGKRQGENVELNAPLPRELEGIINAMLSDAPYDRAVNLADLAETLKAHFEGPENTIRRVAFSRRDPHTLQPASPLQPLHTTSRGQRQVPISLAYAGLAAIAAAAVALFLLLPRDLPEPNQGQPATGAAASEPSAPARVPAAPPQPAGASPMEQARLDLMRAESEKVATEILRRQIELEDIGANLWAQGELEDIATGINEAEETFLDGNYPIALDLYQALLGRLTHLKDSAGQVLAENVSAGDAALESGDSAAALAAFSIATAIDPRDPQLAAKMTRAKNLPGVLSLVNQAEVSEREGDLGQALEHFRAALRLDGLWQPARSGETRVAAAMEQQRFSDAMSRGFVALTRKDYRQARESFADAAGILPDSTEPQDGMLQVEQAEKEDRILQLKSTAEAAFARDDWQQAMDAYSKALAIDGSLVFASEGLTNARRRLEIETSVTAFLSDPAQLQDDDSLAEARRTLTEASRADPGSAEALERINTLAKLISSARIEIPVTITSDNRTDVTVYKVGGLGQLESTQLSLIPGRYTIIGKRPGYRDVRRDITVLSGEPVPPVAIVCDERI